MLKLTCSLTTSPPPSNSTKRQPFLNKNVLVTYIQFGTRICSGSCTARSGQTASVAGEMEGLFFLWSTFPKVRGTRARVQAAG